MGRALLSLVLAPVLVSLKFGVAAIIVAPMQFCLRESWRRHYSRSQRSAASKPPFTTWAELLPSQPSRGWNGLESYEDSNG
jgi:hypothetical protein